LISNRLPITVRLDSFEGPLDLLLYFIQSNELDISKVSIGKITDQYLSYVRIMQELDFDIASEFLVMAATLLHWKSRALLPKEEKIDPSAQDQDSVMTQEELVRQLIDHQRFRQAGEDISQFPLLGLDVFTRSNRKPPIERVWRDMNITDLAITYQQILVRSRKRTQVLKKETVSISDKIKDFAKILKPHERVVLQSLLSEKPTREEIVASFLASLELARLKVMRVYQEEVYSSIYLELLQSLKDFDLELASGYEYTNNVTPKPKAAPEVSALTSESSAAIPEATSEALANSL
jgi:segregation and condensation protein A